MSAMKWLFVDDKNYVFTGIIVLRVFIICK